VVEQLGNTGPVRLIQDNIGKSPDRRDGIGHSGTDLGNTE
jgi:hypothetical protein